MRISFYLPLTPPSRAAPGILLPPCLRRQGRLSRFLFTKYMLRTSLAIICSTLHGKRATRCSCPGQKSSRNLYQIAHDFSFLLVRFVCFSSLLTRVNTKLHLWCRWLSSWPWIPSHIAHTLPVLTWLRILGSLVRERRKNVLTGQQFDTDTKHKLYHTRNVLFATMQATLRERKDRNPFPKRRLSHEANFEWGSREYFHDW